MNKLFRIPEYTEDLKYSRLILHLHVASRTVMLTGGMAIIGSALGCRFQLTKFQPLLLRTSFPTLLAGLGLGIIMTEGRMFGRLPIEWQDRSFRVLSNTGQNTMDKHLAFGLIWQSALLAAKFQHVPIRTRIGLLGVGTALVPIQIAVTNVFKKNNSTKDP